MRLIRKLTCFVRGHDARVHQQITPWSRRIVCDRCGGDWGRNDDVRITLPWSDELEQFYTDRGYVIKPLGERP